MLERPNPEKFHPENPIGNELEEIRKMKKDARLEIYRLSELLKQAKHGVRIDETVEELQRKLDKVTKTYETLLDDDARLMGIAAREDSILQDVERQFEED